MRKNYFIKWLILAVVMGMSELGMAQFNGEGIYTFQCQASYTISGVTANRYISVSTTDEMDVLMAVADDAYSKFSIVANTANSGKYNIISKDNNLLTFDGSNIVLIDNTEANRNLSGSLFSFPTVARAVTTTKEGVQSLAASATTLSSPNHFIQFANAANTITGEGRINGQKSSGADVGQGFITIDSYKWAFERIGDLPGASAPAATALVTPVAAGQRIVVNTSIDLKATASAATGNTISKVEFFEGANLLGEGSLVGSEYVYSWTPGSAATYSITSKVTDSGAQTATSTAADVIVVNAKSNPVKSVHINFEDVDVSDWNNEASSSSTLSIENGKGIGGSKALAITQSGTGAKHAYSLREADKVYLDAGESIHIIASVATSDVTKGQPMLSFRRDDWTGPTPTTILIPGVANEEFATRTFSRSANTLDNFMDWSPRTRTNIASAGETTMYYDNLVLYAHASSSVDLTAPDAPTSFTSTPSTNTIGWTEGADATTGVQKTIILRTTNTSASAPVLLQQGSYSPNGGTAGDNTIGDWTIIGEVNAGTSTYTDNAVYGGQDYLYAIVHRDLAYNYSSALVSAAVNPTTTTITSSTSISTVPDCPTCDLVVNTGAELTIDADRTYNSLTIKPSGKVTNDNATSTTLTITNNLTLESSAGSGTGTYVEKQNGTLIVNGTTTVQQYLATATGGRNYFISSPVASATSNVVKSEALNKLWSYTEANSGTVLWNEISATNVPLTVMAGYVAKLNAAGNISFTGGALNTGSKTSPALTNTGTVSTGFNLVGNPYPSYVNWNNATKTNVSTSIWYRSKSTGSYLFQTYNVAGAGVGANGGSELIPPMQSFWVKATAAGASVTFENSMRSHQDQGVAGNRLKTKAASTQQLIRLQVTANEISDEAVVYFNENASNGLDMYDSEKMWNNSVSVPEIYTVVNNKELVINGMRSMEDVQSLSLGFKTGQTSSFSIKATEVTNLDAYTRIILKDNQENTETDITEGAAYNFNSDAVNSTSRFTLLLRAPSLTTGLETSKLSMSIVRNGDNQLIVNSGSAEKGQINIFNAMGQKVKNLSTTGNSTLINHQFESGVYIFTVEIGASTATQKIIIH